jgi:ligand-binding SRPBCC domain-containing protein
VSTVEVTQRIDAPPGRVWQFISDPTAMTGLTEECVGMAWTGGHSRPAVGARFRGRNRSGWHRWSTSCTIVAYQPGSEIAWDVSSGPLPVARWSYRLEAGDEEGTTVVRETFEDRRGTIIRIVGPMVRGTSDAEGRNRANMTATLDRLKARAES